MIKTFAQLANGEPEKKPEPSVEEVVKMVMEKYQKNETPKPTETDKKDPNPEESEEQD